MERKINRVGQNTLTISLPSKWVKENKLKQGDELNCYIKNKEIIFSSEPKKEEKKEIMLNIDKFSKFTLSRYLTVLYRNNYTRIVLTYSHKEISDPKNKKYVNIKHLITGLNDRFIGFDIVSQTAEKTVIESFITKEKRDLDIIEKRIYFLLKETFDQLLEAIGKNYALFHETIYDHHDNITKFINYYLRQLGASDKNEEERKKLYTLYVIVDKLLDKVRHLSEQIAKHGCSNKAKEYIKKIFDLQCETFQILHRKKFSEDIIKKRYELVEAIQKENFDKKEITVICEIKIFLDVLSEFIETIIVIQLNKQIDQIS